MQAFARWSLGILLLLGNPAEAQMSDGEFYRLLNLETPGLEALKSALASGDTARATEELLRYYQERAPSAFFPLGSGGSTADADQNRNHYYTVVGITKFAGAPDGSIDWTTSDPQDAEWHWQFHRMYWVVNYGKVYASRKDERYAAACVADITDWIRDNASGYPRTLDTGIRLVNWVTAYRYLVQAYRSPSLSASDHLTILKSLIRQCQFLRSNWRSDGNWGASETLGLSHVVMTFPELTFADNTSWTWWKDLVISRLQHHLSVDFYPDGVQFETSPSYGCLEYRNLFLAYKLMTLNGISVSQDIIDRFVRPLEYMMHIHRPDGYLAQFSDTDRGGYLSYLKEGAELFGRQDMLFASTRGAQGSPPAKTFGGFPQGGVFVMRSDWGTNQAGYASPKFLAFDMSSNEPWHAHSDILTFEAYASGRMLVRDAGRYTYVSGSWRDYFKGTQSHNTITIDSQDQATGAVGQLQRWTSLPGCDEVVGSHQAYSGLTVQRSIYFAKPDYWIISDIVGGTGTHRYDLHFHLGAEFTNGVSLDRASQAVTTSVFGLFPSDTTSQSELLSGWVSDSYNQKAEAPVLRRRKEGPPPVTFENVLIPYSGTIPRVDVSRVTVIDDGVSIPCAEATAIRIGRDERTDWYFRSQGGGALLSFGPFTTDAVTAFIGVDPAGLPLNIQVLHGSLLFRGDSLLCDTGGRTASISTAQTAVFIVATDLRSARVWAPVFDTLYVNGTVVQSQRIGNYLVYEEATGLENPASTTASYGGFRLEQNFPNPFNPRTRIAYALPPVPGKARINVEVKVFDLLGRPIAVLVDGEQIAGTYSVDFDGSRLTSGVYYCTLRAGSFMAMRKMLLLK